MGGSAAPLVVGLLASCGAAVGQVPLTWTNATGNGQWSTAGNWTPTGPPSGGQDAVVGGGGTVTISQQADVRTLTAQAPLNHTGGTLTINGPSVVADYTGTGGTQVVANALLDLTGTAFVQSSFDWGGAGGFRKSGAGVMTARNLPLFLTTLTNDGTIRVDGLSTISNATLHNRALLEMVGAGRIAGDTGTTLNEGTVRKPDAGIASIGGHYRQTGGRLEAVAGELHLARVSTLSGGVVDVATNARVRIGLTNGPHTVDGTVRFEGNGLLWVNVAGDSANPGWLVSGEATLDFPAAMPALLEGGFARVTGEVVNRGDARWSFGSTQGPGQITVDPGVLRIGGASGVNLSQGLTVLNRGVVITTGTIGLNAASVVNDGAGLLQLHHTISGLPTTSRVLNRGLLYPQRESPPSLVSAAYDQQGGRTRAFLGSLTLSGGGLWTGDGRFELGFDGVTVRTVELNTARFEVGGGTHEFSGVGVAKVTGGATLAVADGATLRLLVADPLAPASERWFMVDNATLDGPGLIVNQGKFVSRNTSTIGLDTFTQFRNEGDVLLVQTTRVFGEFRNAASVETFPVHFLLLGPLARVINERDWVMDAGSSGALIGPVSGQPATGVFINESRFSALGGNVSALINSPLDNRGRVVVSVTPPAQVFAVSFNVAPVQLVGGTLTGGEWECLPGARIFFPTPISRLGPGTRVRGSGHAFPSLSGLRTIDGGRAELTGDFNPTAGPVDVIGGGTLVMGPGARVQVPQEVNIGPPPTPGGQSVLGYCEEHVVVGAGPAPPVLVTPILNNWGVLRPGGPGAAGPFNLEGGLVQHAAGAIEVEVGGLSPEDEHDRVNIVGSATLAGTLRASMLGAFQPARGERFHVLAATGAIVGALARLEAPVLATGDRLRLVGDAAGLWLVVACPADTNADGEVDFNDLLEFLNQFNRVDPQADLNDDGEVDFNDFLEFLNRFNAGC